MRDWSGIGLQKIKIVDFSHQGAEYQKVKVMGFRGMT